MDEFELSIKQNKIQGTLKRRYSNRHKTDKPNSDLVYIVKSVKEKRFNGDVCYYNFKNAGIKIITPKGKTIVDNNYRLLEFYDYNSKVKLSAFYNDSKEIIEWYFDIVKKIGKENEVLYIDDLYLDIVVRPDGKIILLDEEEIEEALSKSYITKEDYEMAYYEAKKLIKLLEKNKKELRDFTNKYLLYFENKL